MHVLRKRDMGLLRRRKVHREERRRGLLPVRGLVRDPGELLEPLKRSGGQRVMFAVTKKNPPGG